MEANTAILVLCVALSSAALAVSLVALLSVQRRSQIDHLRGSHSGCGCSPPPPSLAATVTSSGSANAAFTAPTASQPSRPQLPTAVVPVGDAVRQPPSLGQALVESSAMPSILRKDEIPFSYPTSFEDEAKRQRRTVVGDIQHTLTLTTLPSPRGVDFVIFLIVQVAQFSIRDKRFNTITDSTETSFANREDAVEEYERLLRLAQRRASKAAHGSFETASKRFDEASSHL